jgi:hypothetical protein
MNKNGKWGTAKGESARRLHTTQIVGTSAQAMNQSSQGHNVLPAAGNTIIKEARAGTFSETGLTFPG